MSEFSLIKQYFKSLPQPRNDVVLGIGDDCAILEVPDGKQLVVSTDTLVSGVHFPENTSAFDIGYKSLAVNLSDLAAMGAEPAWVTLCLTLPEENQHWLSEFVKGFSELLVKNNMQLVGGDTTRGPLSISVHVSGFVEKAKAFRRDTARLGDYIFVTGTIGDAGLGLKSILDKMSHDGLHNCEIKLNRPVPRNAVAKELIGFCHCAIDVSDGLLADLNHICEQSRCGAELYLDKLPLSHELKSFYENSVDMSQVLSSGDDYELCFAVDKQYVTEVEAVSNKLGLPITNIGTIVQGSEVVCLDKNNHVIEISKTGFEHF